MQRNERCAWAAAGIQGALQIVSVLRQELSVAAHGQLHKKNSAVFQFCWKETVCCTAQGAAWESGPTCFESCFLISNAVCPAVQGIPLPVGQAQPS